MTHTVALTGATGFVGGAVMRRLLDEGLRVRVLVRSSSDAGRIARDPRCEAVPGSLEDTSSLRRLVTGVAAVVHCAGAVRGFTADDFNRVNVDGLARLVDVVSALTDAPRLLALSSLAAREPALSPYAASKRAGETVLEERAGAIPWIALRPPAVYGPGDRELLPLFRLMNRGIAPLIGSPTARFSLIYVDDLAGAVWSWLAKGTPVCGVFEVHDGRQGGYSWRDVVDIAARHRGGRVIRMSIPRPILRAVAVLSTAAARTAGRQPMLTLGKVRELTHEDWVCDNTAFGAATGWRPRVSFEEGLRRTLAAGEDPVPSSKGLDP